MKSNRATLKASAVHGSVAARKKEKRVDVTEEKRRSKDARAKEEEHPEVVTREEEILALADAKKTCQRRVLKRTKAASRTTLESRADD